MQPIRRLFVGLVGQFCRLEETKIMVLSVTSNVSLPLVALFMPRDALKPGFICNRLFNIFHIFKSICDPQVFQSIVRWVPVYMVNFTFRPLVMCHRPRNPMGSQEYIINSYDNVPSTIKACNGFASSALTSFYAPTQLACARVVRQKFFEAGDFWMFHAGNMATLKPIVNGGKF